MRSIQSHAYIGIINRWSYATMAHDHNNLRLNLKKYILAGKQYWIYYAARAQ